jgi:hypothetical protein
MKKIIYIFTALLAIGIASSCKKFVDINDNPNAPTSVDASTLLPPMLAGMARGNWYDSRYIGQYVQIWGAPTALTCGIRRDISRVVTRAAKCGARFISALAKT